MGNSRQTSKKLIDAAIELFSKTGFKGTSIRDIAKLSGIRMHSIYYHFESKYGLLLAVLEHLSQGLQDALRRAIQMEADPLERFKLLLRTHMDQVRANEEAARLFFLDEEELSPDGNAINKRFQTDILNIYREELQKLQAAGYVKFESATVAAFNILGVIQWHLRWYRPDGPLSFDRIKEEAVRFILYGVTGNPPLCTPNKQN